MENPKRDMDTGRKGKEEIRKPSNKNKERLTIIIFKKAIHTMCVCWSGLILIPDVTEKAELYPLPAMVICRSLDKTAASIKSMSDRSTLIWLRGSGPGFSEIRTI